MEHGGGCVAMCAVRAVRAVRDDIERARAYGAAASVKRGNGHQ